jgi:hypothetical protein
VPSLVEVSPAESSLCAVIAEVLDVEEVVFAAIVSVEDEGSTRREVGKFEVVENPATFTPDTVLGAVMGVNEGLAAELDAELGKRLDDEELAAIKLSLEVT